MKPLYIFDIDGTIANLEHRLHFITRPLYSGSLEPLSFKPDWDAFHAFVKNDSPIKSVILTLNQLADAGSEIWFFTGRMESCRQDTEIWLFDYVNLDDIILEMRPNGDHRPDWKVKEEMFNNMLQEDYERLVAVFDDRQQVVDMWRRYHVTCFQCAKGDF